MNRLFDEEAAINQYNSGGEQFYLAMPRDPCTFGLGFDEQMSIHYFKQSGHSIHAKGILTLENQRQFQNGRLCNFARSPYVSIGKIICSFKMASKKSMPIQLLISNVFGLDQTAEQSNGQPASKGYQKRTDLKELNKSIKKAYAKGKQYSEEVNFLNAKRQDILKTAGQLTEEQKSWFKRHKQDLTTKIKANMQLAEQLEKKLNQIDDNEFQLQESDLEEETDDEDDFDHQIDMGRENPKSNIQNM